MLTAMIIIFLLGYMCIALEHPLKVNKAATAILTGTILWVLYTLDASNIIPKASAEEFETFLNNFPFYKDLPFVQQCIHFVVDHQVLDSIGEICETLIFLIGAMTIVELVDSHGGFKFITDKITTKSKRKLLFVIGSITFIMSAVLDNLTTSIVMIMLVQKLITDAKERCIFGSIIIIAANSGGAWSPIGDITTIMLWVRGNISTDHTIPYLLLPCIVSALIPIFIVSRSLKGDIVPAEVIEEDERSTSKLIAALSKNERLTILILGIFCLVFVPVFKVLTHLPPFVGILLGVGILWVYTDMMYGRVKIGEDIKLRLSKVISRIDGSTLMFFLGILFAVDALKCAGILSEMSSWLDRTIGNVYLVNLVIGTISSIVDNVPLVAGAMGMYPIATDAMVASAADPVYMANFVQDGIFWQFLAYCAGVGGSMLIIGSAAGVVVMGLEKINFIWYLKHFSWLALIGYLAGAGVYILERMVF
jgi:Na+/H+ antiporter NhaD/arsenite permease-like protein